MYSCIMRKYNTTQHDTIELTPIILYYSTMPLDSGLHQSRNFYISSLPFKNILKAQVLADLSISSCLQVCELPISSVQFEIEALMLKVLHPSMCPYAPPPTSSTSRNSTESSSKTNPPSAPSYANVSTVRILQLIHELTIKDQA